MSAWRQKAIECMPECRQEFQKKESTIYDVFFEILPATQQAHIEKDNERLNKFYEFAEWCFNQKDEELWNAAGVCFYEHLGDNEETFSSIHIWIKKSIYAKIRGLLAIRLDNEKINKLDRYFYG